MVEQPKRISSQVKGWRQVFPAKALKAACKSPAAGGAANSGPMIAKRSRAHRSRLGRSSRELTPAPLRAGAGGTVDGRAAYKAASFATIRILCG